MGWANRKRGVRTGSKFLGLGNAKANVASFILRDAAYAPQLDAPGTLQFPAAAGVREGSRARHALDGGWLQKKWPLGILGPASRGEAARA